MTSTLSRSFLSVKKKHFCRRGIHPHGKKISKIWIEYESYVKFHLKFWNFHHNGKSLQFLIFKFKIQTCYVNLKYSVLVPSNTTFFFMIFVFISIIRQPLPLILQKWIQKWNGLGKQWIMWKMQLHFRYMTKKILLSILRCIQDWIRKAGL